MTLQEKLYKPVVKNGDYLFRSDKYQFSFPVEIHFSRIEKFENKDSFKVLVLTNEPKLSVNRTSCEDAVKNCEKYDLILCSDNEILDNCSNAKKLLYGGTWLNRGCFSHPDGLGEYDSSKKIFNEVEKEFSVSFLASWYNINRPGYMFRNSVWSERDKITIPKKFYTSVKSFRNAPNPLPTGEKEVLFNSMYHICIENYSIHNYFSEKIIDPMLTETIPIYWGCTNITDYFNKDGLILVKDTDDMIEKINLLTEEYYYSKIDAVKENKQKAIEYATFDKNVWMAINENRK